MNEVQKEKIRIWIQKGKWNYVLKVGILFWGIPYSVGMYLFNVGFKFILNEVLFWLIVGVFFGGTIFGLLSWWYINKKFNQS